MVLQTVRADLHVHTCLSPCGEAEMVPSAIVDRALKVGLDVIGICDHNSAANVLAVKQRSKGTALCVLGGMEITTVEEVHVMAFFEWDDALMAAQDFVADGLEGENDETVFGFQWIVDAEDVVVGRHEQLLIGATRYTLEETIDKVHELGGIAIASHIDREAFSIVGQLGFVPPALALDAVELSANHTMEDETNARTTNLPVVCSSDAHCLASLGTVHTEFVVQQPSFEEIESALKGEGGRGVRI